MIELKNVTKTYKSKVKKEKHFSLKNVNIKFNKTGLIFIVGESNSGKSTLLDIIGGLDVPSEGELIINGKSSSSFTSKEYDYYRNTYVSFIFKDYNLLDNESVAKNINLALDFQEKKLGKGELRRVLDIVGLNDISEGRLVKTLSAGQMQKVSIARAIVKNPYVVIADEPAGNLDSVTSREVYDLLKRMSKNKLVIVATHDREAAERYGDRTFDIKDGVIVVDSNYETVTPVVENFGLIKTRVPFMDMVKYGIKNLFQKKLYLLLMLFFLTLTFTGLGLVLSSTNYNLKNQHIESMVKNDENEIKLIKYNGVYDKLDQYKSIITLNFNNLIDNRIKKSSFSINDVAEVEKNTGITWNKEYTITQNKKNPAFEFPYSTEKDILYYVPEIKLNVVTDNFDFDIIGRVPQNSNEIIISKYVADNIIKNGISLNNNYNIYLPKSYEQIVNEQKEIVISNLGSAKIVGIKDDDLEYANDLKKILYTDLGTFIPLQYNKLNYYINNIYNRIYTTNDFINRFNLIDNNINYKTSKIRGGKETSLVHNFGYLASDEYIYTAEGIKQISDVNKAEIVISYDYLDKITDGGFSLRLEDFLKNNPNGDQDQFIVDFLKDREIKVYTNVSNKISSEANVSYRLQGVLMNRNIVKTNYYNKDTVYNLIPKSLEVTSLFSSVDNPLEILNKYPIEGSSIVSQTRYSKNILELSTISYFVNLMGKYGIIVCVLISLFMIQKLIVENINNKKLEIKIYRTLGASVSDIKSMFTIESVFLAILTIITSNYLINYIVNYYNSYANRNLENNAIYLVYDIPQMLIVSFSILISIMIIVSIKASKKSLKNVD